MRTNFSPAQRADPLLAEADKNLRACVHCGICTATCPTYVLLGDERDSPRGRIVMMQRMLEEGAAPSPETVLHVDRCLSCLACKSACPSGVDYARLVDQARAHIEAHHRRPLRERVLRWAIVNVLTRPVLVRLGLVFAHIFAPIAKHMPGRIGTMARKAIAMPLRANTVFQKTSASHRVLLLRGCVQAAIAPQIDEAVARVLARRDVAVQPVEGCCGALAFHLGKTEQAKNFAKNIIEQFERAGDCDGVLISATGCVAHLKDYAHLFANDPEWSARAKTFAAKVKDFSELATPRIASPPKHLRIAYQIACSLQHSQRLSGQGEALLKAAGHEVLAIPEGHLCCGSAGSYSILQPEIAGALRERKLTNINSLAPDVVVSGNIGCISHLSGEDAPPIVHLAEILDWSEGGPSLRASNEQD